MQAGQTLSEVEHTFVLVVALDKMQVNLSGKDLEEASNCRYCPIVQIDFLTFKWLFFSTTHKTKGKSSNLDYKYLQNKNSLYATMEITCLSNLWSTVSGIPCAKTKIALG